MIDPRLQIISGDGTTALALPLLTTTTLKSFNKNKIQNSVIQI